MENNILTWINKSKIKEVAEELLLGPQEDILSDIQRFNEIYDTNLGITKQFRWKPGTYEKYKKSLNKFQSFEKRANSLQRIHYRMEDVRYRLGRMKTSIVDIESKLFGLRNDGQVFQDNTDSLENALAVIKTLLEENTDITCLIRNNDEYNNRTFGSKVIDLIVPINGNKLFIKTPGLDSETIMTHEYPFEVETRLTVGLNKFLNYFISSIETPDKPLRNLNISVGSKLLNNLYRVKHPFINRGWDNNANAGLYDENNNFKNYIYSCMGNMQDDIAGLVSRFDLYNLKWFLEKWNSNFVFNVTNPLNNTKTLYHGNPEFLTDKYKDIRGSNNLDDGRQCTYNTVWEYIPEGTEHYCDKYKCTLRDNCVTYNLHINLTLEPIEEAMLYELSEVFSDDITILLRQYKSRSNMFCNNIKDLQKLIDLSEEIHPKIKSIIEQYVDLVNHLYGDGYLYNNHNAYIRTETSICLLWDVLINVVSLINNKPDVNNIMPDNQEKDRVNSIFQSFAWDIEDLINDVDYCIESAGDFVDFTVPYPEVDAHVHETTTSDQTNQEPINNEPLPTEWAEFMANRNRRPI